MQRCNGKVGQRVESPRVTDILEGNSCKPFLKEDQFAANQAMAAHTAHLEVHLWDAWQGQFGRHRFHACTLDHFGVKGDRMNVEFSHNRTKNCIELTDSLDGYVYCVSY